ncbi:MAG: hypothetical protein ABL904_04045 [Hyphomicrobiaceae bacterium]
MFDMRPIIAKRVAAVTTVFGPPRTDAQKRYLENAVTNAFVSTGCFEVAARAYATAFGTSQYPDIDVVCELARFYGELADAGGDTFKADPAHDEVLRRMSWHCAELATMRHARELAKGGLAIEKMRKFGRALLGSASSIAPRHQ